ncbi:hypothetical protein WJX73_006741 [Symbiochloris irregularis]|uniref:Plastocyanin n=1 Tax=Symbiochloris irregularis TaxID=706552 RepID=A0AAW1NQ04_9CHLO
MQNVDATKLGHAHEAPLTSACCRAFATAAPYRVVFLGTPEVAARSLKALLTASQSASSTFKVAAVISQPGRPKGRGKKRIPQPSPVEQVARDADLDHEQILVPVSARDGGFLDALRNLRPHLCVTAAYGNILPQAFLDIPEFGTLNIHPSLLPAYRGAAPVQRALMAGEQTTGLLLHKLPSVWDGSAAATATPQDEEQATHAAKLTKTDSMLDFREPARVLHNKQRPAARAGPVCVRASLREDVAKAVKVASISAASLGLAMSANAATVKLGADGGGLVFDPANVTIKSGETVEWVNNVGFPHNVVFDEDEVPEGVSVDSLNHEDYLNAPGQKVSSKFSTAGTYKYYCEPHQGAGMAGSITVQ